MPETEEEGRDDVTKGDGGTEDTSSDEGCGGLKEKEKEKKKIEGVVSDRRVGSNGRGSRYH